MGAVHPRAIFNLVQYPKSSPLVQAAPNASVAPTTNFRRITENVSPMPTDENSEILAEGRFLRLLVRDGWEFAARRNVSGIVVIAAEHEGNLLLVEQYRPPFQKPVIELPAGLAGDQENSRHESLETAARRELLEETGYEARLWEQRFAGPISAGMTTEFVTFFQARQLTRRTSGGGDEAEQITLHEIPLPEVPAWLANASKTGRLVDPKVYLGLYLLSESEA